MAASAIHLKDLHGMPLLNYLMIHDEDASEFRDTSELDSYYKHRPDAEPTQQQSLMQTIHFKYFNNTEEHGNFTQYPTKSLDGVQKQELN